jgi:hypothetical protein
MSNFILKSALKLLYLLVVFQLIFNHFFMLNPNMAFQFSNIYNVIEKIAYY